MDEDQEPTVEAELASVDVPTVGHVPFSLVEKHANKTTQLLANSGKTQPIEGQRRWFNYEFKEPLFITQVVVRHNNYQSYHEFQLRATLEDNEVEARSRPVGDAITFQVNDFCDQVSFRPPRSYFLDRAVTAVEIFGFRKNDVARFIRYASSIDEIKEGAIDEIKDREKVYRATIERAAKSEEQASEAKKEVSSLKSQADRQRSMIRRLESERSDLTTKVEALSDSLNKNNNELETLRREIKSKTESRDNISSEVEDLERSLSELKENIDLFPSELDSFVRQGARNNRTYFYLALAPIVVILSMFFLLVSGAVDLTTEITSERDVNLEALVISRMPYVLVALAIITACYKIARSFILELMNVNRQRLNLTKVSIIAKDISNSAESGLSLDDETKYNLRLKLKMDMLKDHLKGYLSREFEPSVPKSITRYLPSSERISEFFKGTPSEDEGRSANLSGDTNQEEK